MKGYKSISFNEERIETELSLDEYQGRWNKLYAEYQKALNKEGKRNTKAEWVKPDSHDLLPRNK